MPDETRSCTEKNYLNLSVVERNLSAGQAFDEFGSDSQKPQEYSHKVVLLKQGQTHRGTRDQHGNAYRHDKIGHHLLKSRSSINIADSGGYTALDFPDALVEKVY